MLRTKYQLNDVDIWDRPNPVKEEIGVKGQASNIG